MRNIMSLLTILFVLLLTSGCANPQAKLQAAKAAENSGDHRTAANLYAALALELSPVLRLHEAQKGKMLPPATWIGEVNKYTVWLTDAAQPRDNAFREALDGLTRSSERYEADNSANTATPRTLDTLNAFAPQWNSAFNPPTSGPPDDWNAVIRRAHEQNFSILRFASPQNYVYDINIVSRKNARRVNFTLYSESQVFTPLPPGDYSIIVKSTVEFQKGKSWSSDFTVFNLTMTDTPALVTMDMRTRVARRE
ncbi:MAG: hypothetical protein FWC23_03225 [Chitinispirillia bacterium]|nr:hypothetical protein [Chitinispirillia bacterium]MCL2268187.1 hypothetical protein [Chitinispirillia bacterium]